MHFSTKTLFISGKFDNSHIVNANTGPNNNNNECPYYIGKMWWDKFTEKCEKSERYIYK